MPLPTHPNSLYIGKVFHERHETDGQPFGHKFTYRVFTLWINLDDLEPLSQKLKYFSFNKWNILSVWNKDHGARDGSDIRSWIERAAKDKNIDVQKIYMLGFARLWGYVFNPLTIYYCYDSNESLSAILYQVKNTFRQQHGYLIPVEDHDDWIKQSTQKVFHVSPFIQMDCEYNFRLKVPDDKLDVAIHQFQPDSKILTATWDGQAIPLTDSNILKTVLKHPLMTLKVIVGIHWEALRLWLKGAKYIPVPLLPKKDVS